MDLARGTLNSELKMVLQRGQRLIRELVIVGATFLPPCAMFILPSFSCFLACNSLHILAFSLPYTAAKRRVRANRLSLMMASCRFNSQLSQRPSAFFFQQS
ncbi:hypothetical protein Pcinc_023677 [Petrolisthes cinctipes]|uniref:Uncharacterized protein n=1 Tax=Petrolisthes cinctipes TaxID=88211 RepID=A0AAE1KE45_PETCI|nr:hypothetical protein Pcinc_023677 [Petrolisthes cinctipes]